MNINPFSFVQHSQNYEASKWPLSHFQSRIKNCLDNKFFKGEQCHVDIVEKLKTIREHHDTFVTHLARIKNEVLIL